MCRGQFLLTDAAYLLRASDFKYKHTTEINIELMLKNERDVSIKCYYSYSVKKPVYIVTLTSLCDLSVIISYLANFIN